MTEGTRSATQYCDAEVQIQKIITPKKCKVEFTSTVKHFYDHLPNGKNFDKRNNASKTRRGRFLNKYRAQGEFSSPISATQFAAKAGSPEVNSRDYITEGPKKSREEKPSFSKSRNF